jgi:hypothetical protein
MRGFAIAFPSGANAERKTPAAERKPHLVGHIGEDAKDMSGLWEPGVEDDCTEGCAFGHS